MGMRSEQERAVKKYRNIIKRALPAGWHRAPHNGNASACRRGEARNFCRAAAGEGEIISSSIERIGGITNMAAKSSVARCGSGSAHVA